MCVIIGWLSLLKDSFCKLEILMIKIIDRSMLLEIKIYVLRHITLFNRDIFCTKEKIEIFFFLLLTEMQI